MLLRTSERLAQDDRVIPWCQHHHHTPALALLLSTSFVPTHVDRFLHGSEVRRQPGRCLLHSGRGRRRLDAEGERRGGARLCYGRRGLFSRTFSGNTADPYLSAALLVSYLGLVSPHSLMTWSALHRPLPFRSPDVSTRSSGSACQRFRAPVACPMGDVMFVHYKKSGKSTLARAIHALRKQTRKKGRDLTGRCA